MATQLSDLFLLSHIPPLLHQPYNLMRVYRGSTQIKQRELGEQSELLFFWFSLAEKV